MSKRETMPLIIAVKIAPMPLTMAISTEPMVRQIDSNYKVLLACGQRVPNEVGHTQETTAPMLTGCL